MKTIFPILFFLFFYTANGQNSIIEVIDRTVTFDTEVSTKSTPNNKSIALCSADTVEYTLAKATGLQILGLNNLTSATSLSQYFNVPQPITVNGASFYAYKADAVGGIALNATVELYLVGLDSIPTGPALATATISVDTTFGGGTLANLLYEVSFGTPVTVNQAYAIVIGNNSPNAMNLVCNSWTAFDGAQEWLANADIGGNWLRSYNVNIGGATFDADPLIYPHVSYDLTVDFTASPLYFNTAPTAVNFTNNSSPILSDRMYNRAAYQGVTALSFTYNFGDGSPDLNAINPVKNYLLAQPYNVTLTDTLYGWRTTCVESEVVMINNPDLVITEIMYNPPEAGADSLEFIEIYNNGTNPMNLTNFTCTGGNYTFPNTTLAAGAFYVIAVDSVAFNNVYGVAPNGEFTSGLSNGGEDIVLKTPTGGVVDSVNYNNSAPWPSGSAAGDPDGGGSSINLCSDTSDNNLGINWSPSANSIGVTINGFAVLASPFALEACCFTAGNDIITTCDSLTWIDGNTYVTSNNTATFTMTTPAGCDSLITLDLTINNSTAGTDIQIACNSYIWIDANTYTTNNNTATYTLTNAVGCDSLVTLDLTINSVDTTTTINVNTITANTATATYQWLDCDNAFAIITGATSQNFIAISNGNYAVEVTENGCTDTSSCVNITGLSVNGTNLYNGFSIYPNPNNGLFTLNINITNATFKVMNAHGQIILNKSITNENTKIDLSNNAKGIYFIRVTSKEGVFNKKVIVQ